MGEIGKPLRRIELEPINVPETVPPVTEPAPSVPEPVPSTMMSE